MHHFQVSIRQPRLEEEKDVGILKGMCSDKKSTAAAYSTASQQDNEGITTSKSNRPNTTNSKIKCQPYPTIINYLVSYFKNKICTI